MGKVKVGVQVFGNLLGIPQKLFLERNLGILGTMAAVAPLVLAAMFAAFFLPSITF